MKLRKVGVIGDHVSALGFGCMGMSEFYGPAEDEKSLSVLEAALEEGIDFYDTADTYGHGHNEELLGRLARGKRDRLFIASKFGIKRDEKGGYKRSIENSPEYIRASCEASLKRLGIDTLDLYYVHRVNPEIPIEETVGEMARLCQEGKIRAIGLSEVSSDLLRRAFAVHPVAAVQNEYSLMTRNAETNGVLDACRELGVSFVAYSPLCRGLLSGKITSPDQLDQSDFRRSLPRFQGKNLEQNLSLVARLGELARSKECSTAQLALAWILSQGSEIIPIVGIRSHERLHANLGALGVELEARELEELGRLFSVDAVAGDRYTAEGMKGVSN